STALMSAANLGWRNGSPLAPSYDQGSEAEDVETIRLLLESGLDLKAKNLDGDSVLHAAVGRGSQVIIRFLMQAGVDLEAVNAKDQTALDLARARRVVHVVELLQAAGASNEAATAGS